MPTSIRVTWPEGERVLTEGETATIGRDPGCDIVIDNPNVSRRHARIERRNGHWSVVDLDSSQGTFRDGAKVAEAPISLTPGHVTLGSPGVGVAVGLVELPPPPGTDSGQTIMAVVPAPPPPAPTPPPAGDVGRGRIWSRPPPRPRQG